MEIPFLTALTALILDNSLGKMSVEKEMVEKVGKQIT